MISCKNSSGDVEDHFRGITKMIKLAKNADIPLDQIVELMGDEKLTRDNEVLNKINCRRY